MKSGGEKNQINEVEASPSPPSSRIDILDI